MEIITKSPEETAKAGERLSADLKGGEIFALAGELGSGKTTFIQGLAKGLGIQKKITSPTFLLMKKYNNLYHLDLYRLEDNVDQELINLGATDIWGKKDNIIVIEWADKASNLPKETKWINFEYVDENKRKITIDE